jgi:hypothetical protein
MSAQWTKEAGSMKLFGVVSTTILLLLLLGMAAPVYAQEQHDDAKPQAQEEEKAKPEEAKPAKPAEDKNVRQEEEKKDENVRKQTSKQDETKTVQNDRHTQAGGRIPDDKFRANFGREHTFRIGHPVIVEGRPRFQYGGYAFVMVDPWPVGWAYTDAVYIDFIDGAYYVIDPVHPGIRIVVNVVL